MGKKFISYSKQPATWWNHACEEAINHRQVLLCIYKSSPILDNWTAYRHESVCCRRALKKEKRLGWRLLCSEFSHKIPTAKIWRFIRSYKNKSLRAHYSSPDYNILVESQDLLLQKLCPPFSLYKLFSPLREFKAMDLPDSLFF